MSAPKFEVKLFVWYRLQLNMISDRLIWMFLITFTYFNLINGRFFSLLSIIALTDFKFDHINMKTSGFLNDVNGCLILKGDQFEYQRHAK